MSTTGETLLSMISLSIKGDSKILEGGTEMGAATMLPKSEPSGFRITSVTCHPAESAMSVISRRVLSLLLKVTCICSGLSYTVWQEKRERLAVMSSQNAFEFAFPRLGRSPLEGGAKVLTAPISSVQSSHANGRT